MFSTDLNQAQKAMDDSLRSMAEHYGLTFEEAEPLMERYKAQVQAAISKFHRSQQQSAQALAAQLEQLAKAKGRDTD